jgi:hypothetical protein
MTILWVLGGLLVGAVLGYAFRGLIGKDLKAVGTAAQTDLTNTAKKL